jgi:hypothetical protein
MAALDDLVSINGKLADWIINTSPPANDAAAAQAMKQVVGLHIQLDQLVTKLQLADLQQQNAALAAVLAKQGPIISGIGKQIATVTNDVKLVQSIISFAAQAVAAAAQIETIVAAL